MPCEASIQTVIQAERDEDGFSIIIEKCLPNSPDFDVSDFQIYCKNMTERQKTREVVGVINAIKYAFRWQNSKDS